ncbi:transmembrane and coiled-coil domains protein 2-like isoform X2 [Scleropages formosus]|uniref:Transmembrane and coiled-coil domain family 2 n=2 Tax=Scleropages formosus TaxID=113540 RepID=A0A8C9V8H4_SCLFO|nr:transmembrane and coiled-coil domains protein 2-like isoform X2 [Scleropages formosus]XP_029105767.1 transmembrane and coiled-coil domains protein 2-like isoform X2 [Scleropages formosus]XP_029105768.1 transmembrane and coiled-coil domains protein 2-like isoform X2 [Scleropages formosus]XP_029105769.1 transmembrane and coiled-coil domains protein 2-like isoform X2 [Scleropages formosus]
MKRCKSDDFGAPEDGGSPTLCSAGKDDTPSVFVVEVKPSDNPEMNSSIQNPHAPGPRNKPPDLKKIQQLSEGSMFGHGLKHLFHSRRRSREREAPSPQEPGAGLGAGLAAGATYSDHDSADEKERSPEMHRVSYAVSLHDLPARPTAFNRVLQQIRARPPIRRGASLHASGRRTKSNPASEAPRGGSPHLARRTAQDGPSGLMPHHSRPRSSSTTDAALLASEVPLHLGPEESERPGERVDKGEWSLGLPAPASHGGSDGSLGTDTPEAGDPQRTRAAVQHLQQKVLKVTEQIRVEQEARDGHVAEYLKLAHNADKQQAARIKQVFEKKNQKSAQTIAHLHKKLEHYHKKLKEIEQNGPTRQPKDVLRDMQQGLKDVGANVRAGISGFGGGVVEGVKGGVSALSHTAVVSKPREFASLIRNKFGSADNIAQLKDTLDDSRAEDAPRPLSGSATLVSSPKYGSEDDCSSATSGSAAGSPAGPAMGSPRAHVMDSSWDTLLEELRDIKAGQEHLEDAMEDMKTQLQRDYSYMTQWLQEERYRYERLEEQLNDLTELHQNEMSNLKQELASMEEKVAYQSYERARDVQEAVESCLTRITKLELQQQQQQVVQLEGVENGGARALLGKLINVILALMAVLLVFVSTMASFITPLMKSRERVAASVLLALLLVSLWKHWDVVQLWLWAN